MEWLNTEFWGLQLLHWLLSVLLPLLLLGLAAQDFFLFCCQGFFDAVQGSGDLGIVYRRTRCGI